LQRQATGGSILRACSLLATATRNLDYIWGSSLNANVPLSISHMDLAERLEDAEASRALFCWNKNIVASCPNQTRRALERED